MFQILHFRAESSYAIIYAALTLHPARTLALVFPAGMCPQVAASGQLEALAAHAESSGKHVTIIGGDTELRARAVAVGFAAATTIDDWRQGRRLATRHAERRHEAEEMGLLVLDPEGRPDFDEPGASWIAEPPLHIATLLEAREQHTRVTPPMHTFAVAELDARDAEAVLLASERYEDEITSRIRATSELDVSWAI
jgi:hypothetical protein